MILIEEHTDEFKRPRFKNLVQVDKKLIQKGAKLMFSIQEKLKSQVNDLKPKQKEKVISNLERLFVKFFLINNVWVIILIYCWTRDHRSLVHWSNKRDLFHLYSHLRMIQQISLHLKEIECLDLLYCLRWNSLDILSKNLHLSLIWLLIHLIKLSEIKFIR